MAAIHVFAIDWVPAATDIASGGGLRSLQTIEALRLAGHDVTFSVPADCRHIRRIGSDSKSLRDVEVHSPYNQLDIIKKTRPEIVVWQTPLIRCIPFTGYGDTVQVCDLIGLPHIEASLGARGLETPIRERLSRLTAPADLVLTGSDEQNGYWLAELSRDRDPPRTAVVPYALPRSLLRTRTTGRSPLVRLHVTGMIYPWSTSIGLLERIADWVAKRNDITLSLVVGTDPGGATDRTVIQRLQALAKRPNVEMPGEITFARAMADYRAGSVSLDIYEPNMERRMAVPIRTVNALTHGVPVLSTIDGTMMRRLAAEGGGIIAPDTADDPIENALDRLAVLSAQALGRMSKAARNFAEQNYGCDTASEILAAAIEDASRRRTARRIRPPTRVHQGAPEARPPHVLVISNVEPHHRELRIDVPFNVLFTQQSIGGYSVWRKGNFSFSTSSNLAEQVFDAIWVQREISPETALALRILGRPFVYDIDDNLFATPGYRPPFSLEMVQTVGNLVRTCSVLSCSTARLAELLEIAQRPFVIDKAIITPNILREQPAPRPVGTPRFVVWGSSDTPALTSSRDAVIKAIRDFCVANHIKLVCLGADPPDAIMESAVEVTHIRSIPYGSYLSVLRSFAPAIMVCPLETNADEGTRAFVNAKSDLKMLEALAGGLVGVFSRAAPYLDSDLPGPILCDNTYPGWMEALNRAWRLAEQPAAEAAFPSNRFANAGSMQPWLEAIDQVRLRNPIDYRQVNGALTSLRGRYERRLLSEAEFDEAYYLEKYPDVQSAIQQGMISGAYPHYSRDGYREGRLGRANDVHDPHNEQVWANLIHTLGDLQTAVGRQARQLESLKARRAIRLALKRQMAK
jgi:hypothetical protein